MSLWPTHCERCGADLSKVSSIVSKFNTETICSPCKARERAHPDYKAADAAEVAAVRAGDMNFPGVGWPSGPSSTGLRRRASSHGAGRQSSDPVPQDRP